MTDELDRLVKERFGSWTEFSFYLNKDKRNLKRHMIRNIEKLNELLLPLGVELTVREKYRVTVPQYELNDSR